MSMTIERDLLEPIASTTSAPFYVTGGTLRGDAASYVRRQADDALYSSLVAGDFCYVLDARQMGKSSLMIRTAARLEAEGITVIKLDLTAVGLDVSPEQWYFGLLDGMGCGLEAELVEFWERHRQLGPLQRWFKAIEEVLLPGTQGRVVIFVDEIDIVRSLPFQTGEFFAGIRECYNRRASNVEMERLAFCLLGVTTPTDLIQDAGMTPFNIGTRIELSDFTPGEAALLAQGLSGGGRDGAVLMDRVLYWTGGHPYLTQKLCREVAEDMGARSIGDVDRVCTDLFLSPKAQKQDNNLVFVRARLLESGKDLASVLELYRRVYANKQILDDETDPLLDQLRLSGIVRAVSGCLRIRNLIYRRVFDRQWIREVMPDSEVRRQKAAFRRGVLRTAVVAAVILAVVGGLALTAVRYAREARRNSDALRQQARQLRQNLYTANLAAAQQALALDRIGPARDLLEVLIPHQGEEDLRTFEWRYLWQQSRDQSLWSYPEGGGKLSPDGKIIATGRTIHILDAASRKEIADLHAGNILHVAFSPNSRLLAGHGNDGYVTLFDLGSRRQLARVAVSANPLASLAFSLDGTNLVTTTYDGPRIEIREVPSLRVRSTLPGSGFVSISLNGRFLATAHSSTNPALNGLTLHDLAAHRPRFFAVNDKARVHCAAFSSDGRLLAAGLQNGRILVWDADTGRRLPSPDGHLQWCYAVNFSPDGRTLVSCSTDGTIRLWDAATGRSEGVLRGHTGEVGEVAYTRDGNALISSGTDGTRLWPARATQSPDVLDFKGFALTPEAPLILTTKWPITQTALWKINSSPDGPPLHRITKLSKRGVGLFVPDSALLPGGRTAVLLEVAIQTPSRARAVLWDLSLRREIRPLGIELNWFAWTRISPDGRLLTVQSTEQDAPLRIWEVQTGRALPALQHKAPYMDWPAFTRDGRMLAQHDAGPVGVWDTKTWRQAAALSVAGASTEVFSHDGRWLAVGGHDGIVRVFDTSSWKEIRRFRASTAGITALAFSPDVRTLAIGSTDPIVDLWNTTNWQHTISLKGQTGDTWRLEFTFDGQSLLRLGGDEKVHIWRTPSLAQVDSSSGTRGQVTDQVTDGVATQ